MRTAYGRGRRASTQPQGKRGKPLEVNPWFKYNVARDGDRAALREALAIGRETITTPDGTCECGRPLWYRPQVSAHTCYACQPGEMVAGAPAPEPPPVHIPEHVDLDPADIEVTWDRSGRDVIVVPDDVARAMRARVQKGWKEWRGQAFGESIRFHPGHWMYDITVKILAAYGDSPVPSTETGSDIGWAEGARRRARGDGGFQPEATVPIVGRSGWDPETRDWVDYQGNIDLHVGAYPNVEKHWSPDTGQYTDKVFARYTG